MAEDDDKASKTEDPTARRLSKARDEGSIPISREVYTWFLLVCGVFLLITTSGHMSTQIVRGFLPYLEQSQNYDLTPEGFSAFFREISMKLIGILILPMAVLMAVSIFAGFIQNGFSFRFENLLPKFSKLSPMQGISRLFSMKNLFEFLKNLFKLTLVCIIVFMLVKEQMFQLLGMVGMDAGSLSLKIFSSLRHMTIMIVIFYTAVTAADFFYQRYSYVQSLRMSKQEIKDEHKESEGDPKIKARIRQIRMEKVRQRMMQSVPTADVVITNPTHYAVALKYDQEGMEAPRLVAKGLDHLALRIRELARDNDVPVIENPPLARALYDSVELEQEIPETYYKAVAEVISYVFKLKRKSLF